MTSDDAAKGGNSGGDGENKGAAADKSEMPPNEANPGAAATAATAEAAEANGGKDAPAANADVEAGKILEQDGVGKVEFTSSKAEVAKKVSEVNFISYLILMKAKDFWMIPTLFPAVSVGPVPGDDQGRADALRHGPLLGAPPLDPLRALLGGLARHARRLRGDHRGRPQVLPPGAQAMVAEGTRLPGLPHELQGLQR